MVKKKKETKPKQQSVYEEMEFPMEELKQTLPIEEPQPESEISEQEQDYLDSPSPTDTQNKNFSQPLMFSEDKTDNLVMWQLRVDWERIEHIIRGHKPKVDEEGNEYFVRIEEHYLNDYGINSILHFLSFYLSKEIFLARYSEDDAKIIMKQFAMQFTDFFFDNLEEFGMDTPEKKKMSKMFVHSIIAVVDASYSKAIGGKTAELINKQFQVLQQQPLSEGNYPSVAQNQPRQRTGIMQRIFG